MLIAGSKGFGFIQWFLALGLIGLIVVSTLPSAKENSISEEEADARIKRANKIGSTLTIVNIGLSVFYLVIVFALR